MTATFRLRLWVPLMVVPALTVIGVFVLDLILSAVFGGPVSWDSMAASARSVAVGAAIGATLGMWLRFRRVWIRTSPTGIELAPQGNAVLLPWDTIDAAWVHRRGLQYWLEVTPKDLYAISTDLPSRDLPAIRYDGNRPVLTMDVSFIFPGPSRLRAALASHTPQSI